MDVTASSKGQELKSRGPWKREKILADETENQKTELLDNHGKDASVIVLHNTKTILNSR